MYNVSKLVALILAFTLGISVGAGLFAGAIAIALTSFTVRDIEKNGIPIPDEAIIGENPEVDILDLNAMEFFEELKTLGSYGDDLTLNFIKNRYALKLPEQLTAALPAEAYDLPLKQLLSMEGLTSVLSTVYIGSLEQYQCLNADGTEGGDPADETSYWVNKDGQRISAIEEIIADYTLGDFISGNVNTSEILNGDIVLADILGYTYNDELNAWYDGEGNKVDGIMAVFAECNLGNISTKLNTVNIGELIGYTKGDDGKWYSTDENGNTKVVDGFMSKIANNTIDSIDGVFSSLEIGDIVPEEDRTGIFAVIPADTKIDDIGTVVNDSIMGSPLQFFINEGLISLTIVENGQSKDMSATLDALSYSDLVTINCDADDFETQKSYYGNVWSELKDSNDQVIGYTVPAWRTQALSSSFAYIINLFTSKNNQFIDNPNNNSGGNTNIENIDIYIH